jgi:alpha-L-rhamnosidase
LLLQLEIEYADGERQLVVSDGTWKAAYGPILEADNYMGETYDARREIQGWDEPWFEDSDWGKVLVEEVGLRLTAHPGEPVRRKMELPAKSVREISPGVFVFDFEQNMVGVARLRVRNAEPGTRITLRFAEVLNPDGTLHTANLRGARATDIYICKGGEDEVFEPRFTYHGFRYVEVTGYPGKPPMDAVMGIVIHTDIPVTGDFKCSNQLLNRLVQNILWSLRGNYFEVPTDCPQRDERQGWTGDAQIFARTAAYFADISAFMTKWLTDLLHSSSSP